MILFLQTCLLNVIGALVIFDMCNMYCATSGAELVYPSKSTQLTPDCSEVHVCSISSFLAVLPRLYCWLYHLLLFAIVLSVFR